MARPNLSYLKNLVLTLTGLGAGLWTGLTGMGLAPVLAPGFVWLLGLRDRRLSALTLQVTIVSGISGVIAYHDAHAGSVSTVIIFALAGVLGAAGAGMPRLAPLWQHRIARLLCCLVTISIGVWLVGGAPSRSSTSSAWDGVLQLFVAGYVSGFVGRMANLGGMVVVPALYACGYSILGAEGNALAVLVLVSVLPMLAYFARREVPEQPASWTGFGAILGALIGSRWALELARRPEAPHLLPTIYGSGLIILGVARFVDEMRSKTATSETATN